MPAEQSTPQEKPAGPQPDAVTGVMLAQGVGVQEPKGFWADAWSQVMKQPIAVASILWIAFVSGLAIFAPVLASGHPIVMTEIAENGARSTVFPLFENLSAGDWTLLAWGILSPVFVALPIALERSTRLGMVVAGGLQLAFSTVAISWIRSTFEERDAADWMRSLEQSDAFPYALTIGVAVLMAALFLIVPTLRSFNARIGFVSGLAIFVTGIGLASWESKPELFDYNQRLNAGTIE
ncbi:MAG: hypothetical protein AAGH64_07100, partial [Planctomycetota bacterium]